MENVEWSESYELGIPEIDLQHRLLFNLVKILLDSIEQEREEEVIETILKELWSYSRYHTKAEEKYFGDGENFDEHRETHKEFRKAIANFKAQYDDQSDEEFIEMMSLYLQAWLEDHVTGMDRRDLLGE